MKDPFQVGDFTVEPELSRIRCGDKSVHVESKAMEVLVYLAQHPKEVLYKEQIIKKVWPDTFVTDDVLTHAISVLRQAFGDDSRHPSVIETLSRKGYRLVAPVSRQLLAETVPEATPTQWWRRRHFLLLSAAIVLVVGGWVYFRWFPSTAPRPASLTPVPLTSYAGLEIQPSLSPDGEWVAFSWNGGNEDDFDIYIKRIDTEPPQRLTTDGGMDLAPAWSPDGDEIAFLRWIPRTERASIFLVPPLGKLERKVGEISVLKDANPATWNYLEWSPDGRWLAVRDTIPGKLEFGIYLLSVETDERRPLTAPASDFLSDSHPSFSPDGRTLAFVRNKTYWEGSIYSLALTDDLESQGEPVRVTNLRERSTYPTWSSGGEEIVFSVGKRFQSHLWQVKPGGGGEAQPLAFTGTGAVEPRFSRSGRLSYTQLARDTNVYQLNIYGKGESEAVRLIASSKEDSQAKYSPDGLKIAFVSNRSGSDEVWVCDRDGNNPMALTSFGGGHIAMVDGWSPDGKYIAFEYNDGPGDIYVVSSQGNVRRVTNHSAHEGGPHWSRNGEWIYFHSLRSGEVQLWRIGAEGGGEARQVPLADVFWVAESSDEKVIYFGKNGGIWQTSSDGGKERPVVENATWRSRMVAEGLYYFARKAENLVDIHFLNFETGENELLTSAHGMSDIAPDGQSILYTRTDHMQSDIMLVEGFR